MPRTISAADHLRPSAVFSDDRRQFLDPLLTLAAVECHASIGGPAAVPAALLRDLVIITGRLAGRSWLEANADKTAAFTALQVTLEPPPPAELDQILARVLSDRFGLPAPRSAAGNANPPPGLEKEAKTMASTSGQEEFLAVIRKSQEAVIAAVRNLAETLSTASPKLASVYAPLTDNLPRPPSVGVPFGDKLPRPEDAVARAYEWGEQLLASQRKFAEDLLRAKPEGAVTSTYDFAEQLLADQRKFAEDLLQAAAPLMPGHAGSAPATETYKPGQVVPRDGTVECVRHHDVQDHVKAGTRFAPCSHHREHSEGCTWQYV